MRRTWWSAARRLYVVAVLVAAVMLLLGAGLVVWGSSLSWRISVGIVTALAVVAWCTACLFVRQAALVIGRRLRGSGTHTFDVFISYSYREHARIVETIHEALEGQGLRVWLDRKGGVPRSSWGILIPLLRGLRRSRSVLFLVARMPRVARPRGSFIAQLVAVGDFVRAGAMIPVEHVLISWHRSFYGVDFVKHTTESWQQWEVRVAADTRVPVTSVSMDSQASLAHDVARAAGKLRRDAAITDLAEKLLPILPVLVGVTDQPSRELPFRPGQDLVFGSVMLCMLSC